MSTAATTGLRVPTPNTYTCTRTCTPSRCDSRRKHFIVKQQRDQLQDTHTYRGSNTQFSHTQTMTTHAERVRVGQRWTERMRNIFTYVFYRDPGRLEDARSPPERLELHVGCCCSLSLSLFFSLFSSSSISRITRRRWEARAF